MRVICEFQTYAEPSLWKIVDAIFSDEVAGASTNLPTRCTWRGARREPSRAA